MSSTLLDVIQLANREFRNFFEEVSTASAGARGRSAMGCWLERIGEQLEQVGQALKRNPRISPGGGEASRDLVEYVENLKRLRAVLEGIQRTLLLERSHLENILGHLRAARAWMASLQETS